MSGVCLRLDDQVFTEEMVLKMDESQLKELVGQCDTVSKLRLLQSWITNQKIVVYIDNLIWKL